MSLNDAPRDRVLRVMNISGGHGVRRRLLALGFHKNDTVELDSKSILGGPLLIRNLTSGASVALGRGIAQKIWVEIVDEK